MKDASSLNPRITLGELGMDSLMGVEVKQMIERDYDLTLTMQEIRQLNFSRLHEIGSGNAAFPVSDKSGEPEESFGHYLLYPTHVCVIKLGASCCCVAQLACATL